MHQVQLYATGKQIRSVHRRHNVYKAGVVRRVNNGRREENARSLVGKREPLKRRIAQFTAPISLRSLREQKPGRARTPDRLGAENRFDMRSITRRE